MSLGLSVTPLGLPLALKLRSPPSHHHLTGDNLTFWHRVTTDVLTDLIVHLLQLFSSLDWRVAPDRLVLLSGLRARTVPVTKPHSMNSCWVKSSPLNLEMEELPVISEGWKKKLAKKTTFSKIINFQSVFTFLHKLHFQNLKKKKLFDVLFRQHEVKRPKFWSFIKFAQVIWFFEPQNQVN